MTTTTTNIVCRLALVCRNCSGSSVRYNIIHTVFDSRNSISKNFFFARNAKRAAKQKIIFFSRKCVSKHYFNEITTALLSTINNVALVCVCARLLRIIRSDCTWQMHFIIIRSYFLFGFCLLLPWHLFHDSLSCFARYIFSRLHAFYVASSSSKTCRTDTYAYNKKERCKKCNLLKAAAMDQTIVIKYIAQQQQPCNNNNNSKI